MILPKTSKRNENIVSVHQPRGKNVRQLTNTKKMATDLGEDTEPGSQATIRARRTPESSYERFGRANRRTERVGEQRQEAATRHPPPVFISEKIGLVHIQQQRSRDARSSGNTSRH